MKQSLMYGSIYQDEMSKDWKKIISEQFEHCADKCKKDNLEIVKWAFDYVAEDKQGKSVLRNTMFAKIALDYAKECANTHMPGVANVSE